MRSHVQDVVEILHAAIAILATPVNNQSLSPQRFRSFIQNVQIAAIDEEAVSLAAGGFFEDAEIDHMT